MKKRWTSLLLCSVMCLSVLLTGCGKVSGDETGGETSGSEVSGEKSESQTMTVAIGTDVNQWDIDKFPGGDGRFVWAQIYETLVRLDKDLDMIPGLATSWETKDDGKTWTFELRKGVKFHDGSDFNADAVIYSYSDRSNVMSAKTLPLESIEKIDEFTVKFVCTKPVPLPTYLTHIAWPVVSPSSVDDSGNFVSPIGSGPYKFVSQTKGEEIVLERNDEYWGEKAKTSKVIFKIIPDATSRVLALKSGDVDVCLKIPESDVAGLEQDKNIVVNRKLSTFTDFLQFNSFKAPFDDVNVRKAVAYAIDTESIVKNILDGIGIAAQGRAYSPCMMYSADDLKLYTQDKEEAKALLEKSGWADTNGDGTLEKDGKDLEISILVGQSWSPREIKIVQACQSQLQDVGFKVTINQVESAAFSEIEKAGEFDIIMRTGYFVWGPYPHHVKIHFSKNYASHYNNPEYDELIMKSESVSDNEKPEIYKEIQQMILDDLPAFYIVHEEKIVATRSNVHGYEISAEDPWLELKGITIDK
jgi:peptide/nickel transport system substrate-binding protein